MRGAVQTTLGRVLQVPAAQGPGARGQGPPPPELQWAGGPTPGDAVVMTTKVSRRRCWAHAEAGLFHFRWQSGMGEGPR